MHYRGTDDYFRYLSKLNKKIELINKNILSFLYTVLYQKSPKFLSLDKNNCYCCSSIICGYNWTPALTIASLLLEDTEINYIQKYSGILNFRLLCNIYNHFIDEFKLNSDLIELITLKLINN